MSVNRRTIKPDRARRQFWYVMRQGLYCLALGFVISFLFVLLMGLGNG